MKREKILARAPAKSRVGGPVAVLEAILEKLRYRINHETDERICLAAQKAYLTGKFRVCRDILDIRYRDDQKWWWNWLKKKYPEVLGDRQYRRTNGHGPSSPPVVHRFSALARDRERARQAAQQPESQDQPPQC